MKANKNSSENIVFQAFDNREALASALTAAIVAQLQSDISLKHTASLAVSGGSTPIPLFLKLSMANLDWQHVTITLVDERWIDNTHEDSNEKLVRDYLLHNRAVAATFVPLKNSAATPFEGTRDLSVSLAALNDRFSVSILGLGEDGHTASFFPQADNLLQALAIHSDDLCLGIDPKTALHLRMTLTLPRILASRQIIIHFTGEKKRLVYQQALEEGPVTSLPIRAIIRQNQTPVTVYWAP